VARRTPASPLEPLFEAANLPELALPAALSSGYGAFGFSLIRPVDESIW